jgi:hypothetical protein
MKQFKTAIILFLLTWLFVGIKEDDEFGDLSLFLKYKPNSQIYFSSPLSMQDMPENYPSNLKVQEAVYDDFINTKHYSQSGFFQFVPDLLLISLLVSFCIGVYRLLSARFN